MSGATSGAAPVRLRQAVVVTRDLPGVVARLTAALDLPEPFVDPGVSEFGLENRVFEVGRDFLEVLTPVREGTAGGRHLDRRGGDSGYMAIFQLDDLDAARRRVADLGIRVVWQADLADISGTHLHPADVGAAIVSLDRADPPESWHWAGPRWCGGAPADAIAGGGGITSLTVEARDPITTSTRWAAVLGVDAVDGTIELEGAAQVIRFVAAGQGDHDGGIVGVGLRLPGATSASLEIAGVTIDVSA